MAAQCGGAQCHSTRWRARLFAALKARSYVDPMVFQKMLDWAANIQLRHQEFRFNLMTVELHHPLRFWNIWARCGCT